MSMNEDRFAGTGKNLGVEQGFGRATGDELEGKLKQATGAAQDIYGQAKDAAADAYGKAKEAAGDAARSVQEHAAPRWLSRSASVGLSAVWADIRTFGSVRPLPELARWAWMAG